MSAMRLTTTPVRRRARIIPAQVLTCVRPQAPEHLIAAYLLDGDPDRVFRALFTVHADGTFDVEATQSTGAEFLDALVLDAARRWTFRPATCNGVPVQSYLRLRVEFEAV